MMALRGILYRKLKQKVTETKAKKEAKREQEPEKEIKVTRLVVQTKEKAEKMKPVAPQAQKSAEAKEEIRGSARYWGGHFLYPIMAIELGELIVRDHTLEFIKYGFLKRPEWSIEIPLSRVEWGKVAVATEEDGIYNITCFTIPFTDGKGVRHQPKFSVENSAARQRFSKFLYERMTRRKR